MSRPSRYLRNMIVAVIVLVVIAGILSPGMSSAFMANPFLNGWIIVLLLIGIGFTFHSVMVLSREINWIESFQARENGEGIRPTAPDPRLLAPMAKVLGEREGRLTLSAMSLRSLLDGIRDRLDESREISRYMIGLLIFFGLLGTFWGLLKTIGAVSDVIGSMSIEQGDLSLVFGELKVGLAAPLAGMGTAFSSSLFGLGGSLVLGFLELQASQAQNRFYNDLEDWLSGAARITTGEGFGIEGDSSSVPAYLQALIEQTAENLDTLRRVMSQGEDNRRQSNTNLMALTERLGTLTDQMRTEQSLMIRLAESQMELKPILNKLIETVGDGAMGIDDASRQHIRNLDIYMHRLLDDLPASRDQIVGEIRGEIKLLARTIAALAEGAD
ncbi:MAG: flagellar motor protein MotA [Alphaproteobacteria bacterium]